MTESVTEMVLDGIRSPIDRVAARVIQNGVHYSPERKINPADQNTPYPIRHPSDIDRGNKHLIGRHFGRLTVMGLTKLGGAQYALWSCRCDCGIYTLRKAKSIRNPDNKIDCCGTCHNLLNLRKKDIFRRTGKHVNPEDV